MPAVRAPQVRHAPSQRVARLSPVKRDAVAKAEANGQPLERVERADDELRKPAKATTQPRNPSLP
jgi:adenosine/AMP kinase